jgi:dTDP-4-dehydrorhamnose reductase
MAHQIIVLGSSSLVGSHFVETFGHTYELSALGRRNIFSDQGVMSEFRRIDMTNKNELQDAIRSSKAELVINFAAETDVDKCELERQAVDGRVFAANTLAPQWIAEACRDSGKLLYQISTDAIFDGTSGPYDEDDIPGLCTSKMSWYGCTKNLAEAEIRKTLDSYCIIRITHPYRAAFEHKTDFARNMLALYSRGQLYPLFDDQVISPSLVDDVSLALDFLIRRNATGIFHVASKDSTTPFAFGCKLISTFFEIRNPASVLRKSSVRGFNRTAGKAPRPVKGGLGTSKLAEMGFTPRTFEEGIDEIHRQSMGVK